MAAQPHCAVSEARFLSRARCGLIKTQKKSGDRVRVTPDREKNETIENTNTSLRKTTILFDVSHDQT